MLAFRTLSSHRTVQPNDLRASRNPTLVDLAKRRETSRTFVLKAVCAGRRAATNVNTQQQSVSPIPFIPAQLQAIPLYYSIPGALLFFAAALQAIKKMRKAGSVKGLVDRGYLDEERSRGPAADPYYSDIMKGINTVDMEALSESQILAARKRRSRERDIDKADLRDIAKIEIPDNHPWAVKEEVTEADEELAKARLSVTRGLPVQDLQGTRGFPENVMPDRPQTPDRPKTPRANQAARPARKGLE